MPGGFGEKVWRGADSPERKQDLLQEFEDGPVLAVTE
jgi:hypothetical protein